MVRSDREHEGDVRVERLGARELERRDLRDDHVDRIVDGVEEGATEVSGGDDSAPRRVEHGRSERRDGGLAVRTRDGHDRHRRALAREVDLAAHGDPGGAGGDERGVVEADERARDDEIGGIHLGHDRGCRERFVQPGPHLANRRRSLGVNLTRPRRVLDDGDVPSFRAEAAGHRQPCLRQPDHHRAHHSRPGPRRCRKSA
jgi:hypothetical protein